MREIKFRAWDKNRKEWLDGKHGEIWFDDGIFILRPKDHIVLMQYTGLKDKNGRELYCGDIVKVYPNPEDEEEAEERIYTVHLDLVIFAAAPFPGEEFEIIGNVFENPELLDNNKAYEQTRNNSTNIQ